MRYAELRSQKVMLKKPYPYMSWRTMMKNRLYVRIKLSIYKAVMATSDMQDRVTNARYKFHNDVIESQRRVIDWATDPDKKSLMRRAELNH